MSLTPDEQAEYDRLTKAVLEQPGSIDARNDWYEFLVQTDNEDQYSLRGPQ